MEIKFQPLLCDDKQEGLRSYLRRSERREPIVFEGRGYERNAIKEQITAIREANKPICSTVVVQGAPGAGKTSLLHQVAKEALRGIYGSGVIPIKLEAEAFNNPVHLLEEFLARDGGNLDAISKTYTKDGKGKFDLQALQFGGGIQSHLPALATRVNETPGRIWNVIKQSLNSGDDPIFILLVDEAQRIEPNRGGKNTLVANLHGALNVAGLKIVPVFAGLSGTRKRLRSLGATRLPGAQFDLGVFTKAEGQRVCLSTFKELGLVKIFTDKQLVFIAKQLEIASDGWPRHLHCYMHHFVDQISKAHNQNKGHLDFNTVLDLGNDERIRYYHEQLELIDHELYEPLMKLAEENMDKASINYKTIEHIFQDKLVNDNELEAFVKTCVHNGILDENRDRSLSFSIPSLKTFLCTGRDVEATKRIFESRMQNLPDTDGAPSGGKDGRRN